MLAETTTPQALETMRAIKRVLDPAGILCRGNILDAGAKVDDRSST
jgi:FAD/FMN-containing dehydrogenase